MALTSFERRVLSVLVGFFAIQTFGFWLFETFIPLPTPWDWLWYPLALGYHGLLWLGLWSIRGSYTDNDGMPLKNLGLPNILTLFRLTTLPTITTVFLLARTESRLAIPLVVFVSFAFLTDLADGFLARTFHMGTRLGKLLDSSTDYVILFSLALVLGVSGVLPAYLLALIVVRLVFQVSAALWVQWRFQRHWVETTWLGKASLFVLMVLFAVEILVFLRLPGLEGHWAIRGLEVFAALTMVVSTLDKAVFFWRKLKSHGLI